MTITNYWWLLIWLFTAGFILQTLFPKEKIVVAGKKEERWSWLAALLLVVPYIIWTAFRTDYFGDSLLSS